MTRRNDGVSVGCVASSRAMGILTLPTLYDFPPATGVNIYGAPSKFGINIADLGEGSIYTFAVQQYMIKYCNPTGLSWQRFESSQLVVVR